MTAPIGTHGPSPYRVKVGTHTSGVLRQFAHLYDFEPIQVLAEYVQNSLDANAKHVLILINEEQQNIHVCDDGDGATPDEIVESWAKIALSLKRGDLTKSGEKGFGGKLAGFSLAERYQFTTRPRKAGGARSKYFSLMFSRDEVFRDEIPEKPLEFSEDIKFGNLVPFLPTSRVILRGVSRSAFKTLTQVDRVADELGETFTALLKRLGTEVQIICDSRIKGEERIKVVPREFPGTRHKPVKLATPHGDVVFEMYTTYEINKRPKILVNHRDVFQFELQKMPGLWSRVQEVLGSGHYQGYIHVSFCELLPNRQGFIADERYETLEETVLRFVDEEARPYLNELKDTTRQERIAEVFRSAVEKMEEYLRQQGDLTLMGKLKGFVSSGHTQASEFPPTSKVFRRKKPPTFDEAHEKRREERERQKYPHKPQERKSATHGSAEHPLGLPRHDIRGQAGLTVVYEPGSGKTGFAWRTRVEGGIIYFNTGHDDFVAAEEKSGKVLDRYVQLHIAKELTRLSVDNATTGMIFREIFDKWFVRYAAAYD